MASSQHVEMDDSELDAMAEELRAEPSPHADHTPSSSFDVEIDDDDLGDMAKELQDEAMSDAAGEMAPPLQQPTPAARPAVTRQTGGIMPSMLSSSMATGLAPGVRPTQASRAAPFTRASFSTKTATARNVFSASANRRNDRFETVLGAAAGDRWRRVVREDEKIMASAVYGPLSLAYKGENSDVRPLSVESATGMALEDAKAVSLEAHLPAGVEEQLIRAVKENGALYLREVEQTARARLATDPDFDPSMFPATNWRFAQLG